MISIHEIEKKSEEIRKLEELYTKSIQNLPKTSSSTDISRVESFIEELFKVTENDFIFIKNIYQQMDEEDIESTDPVKYRLIDEILQDALYHVEVLLNFIRTLVVAYSPFITAASYFLEKLQLLENAIKVLTYGSVNPLNLTDDEIKEAHKEIQAGKTKTLQEVLENLDEET